MCGIKSLLCGLTAFANCTVLAQPLLTSWYTERSGSYARIYETVAAETNQTSVTTWSRGQGTQSRPTYAGVHEISHTDNWVYIRTSNLASYIMGPWYGDEAKTNLFPSYPANQAVLYRFPRVPVDPTTITPKVLTGGGPIGYFVNGVAMFDSRDAFTYNSVTGGENPGTGAWNRDAYENERVTFDASNAHQAGGRYHYHANPPGLRHQLGDSVAYDVISNRYTEIFTGEHSPILGWVRDGFPVYGPYGYSDPMDASSAITRMRSGYQVRTDIAAPGSPRTAWPAWATRAYNGNTTYFDGPDVSAAFPLGRYLEDKDYKGDLGMTQGTDFDLDEFNVRFCKTPEFPNGTWAYFICIEADGTPVYPYNMGRLFFGDPVGDNATAIPDADEPTAIVTGIFEGGPEAPLTLAPPQVDEPSPSEVTLFWTASEGGSYEVLESTNIIDTNAWSSIESPVFADSDLPEITHTPAGPEDDFRFYRVRRTGISSFDDTGFVYDPTPLPPPGAPVAITVAMSGGPEDLLEAPLSLTFNASPVDIATATFSRPTRQSLVFDADTFGLAPGDYAVTAQYATGPLRTGIYTVHTSILLLIVDDWGHDASPLDNTTPNAHLPNMPQVATLASTGVRFIRAYSQPTCSPMRATMMTGRQPFQHGVGSPENAGQFSNAQDEITLPEIFTTMNAPHQMLSVGKWHLGGNDDGYDTRGGWPEFYGITGGGVPSYSSWPKNSNGTSVTTTTYSTTDQVNEASQFIATHIAAGNPWFAWVAFNAPHSPFHVPPAELAPLGGYSVQGPGEATAQHQYRMMLEALDTEIGRLLGTIDPASTQIMLIGDNGTPNQVAQAPYGGGHAKGDLYNGGIHVPMIASGPAVTLAPGSTTTTLVHCVDMFSTILELANINEAAVPNLSAQEVHSTSIVPILNGTDSADRCVIAEQVSVNDGAGRAIILDEYADYKLIINGDPDDPLDTPVHEFFYLPTDINEMAPLAIGSLSGTALVAYNACLAKDTALGGGYNDAPSGFDTVYITLPTTGVTPNVPTLTQPNGNAINVTSVTIDGQTATVVGRFDSGASLGDEGDDLAARYGVKVRISPANGGPYNTAHVVFPNQPANQGGAPREYDSVGALLVNPNP